MYFSMGSKNTPQMPPPPPKKKELIKGNNIFLMVNKAFNQVLQPGKLTSLTWTSPVSKRKSSEPNLHVFGFLPLIFQGWFCLGQTVGSLVGAQWSCHRWKRPGAANRLGATSEEELWGSSWEGAGGEKTGPFKGSGKFSERMEKNETGTLNCCLKFVWLAFLFGTN